MRATRRRDSTPNAGANEWRRLVYATFVALWVAAAVHIWLVGWPVGARTSSAVFSTSVISRGMTESELKRSPITDLGVHCTRGLLLFRRFHFGIWIASLWLAMTKE